MTPSSLLCLLGLAIGLAGCVSHEPVEPVGNLAASQNWLFTGKLGVRTPNDSSNLGIEWRQQGERFEIGLSGPLGLSAARIQGNGNHVTLETREGEAQTASSPDELIMMVLGYDIPVEPMQYWVRGIPAPWAPYTETNEGMRQLGWLVTWNEWQGNRPTKMTFRIPQATLKLVVRSWQVDP
ncbi:MAG: lipoprotein insertase outer membrane protein LolB [Pseudomonadales bacterium]